MPLFGGLTGADQIINQLSLLTLRFSKFETRFKQFEEIVMADFTNLETALAGLSKEVGEVITLLESDSADQAKVDAAAAKLTVLKDALDAFTPDAPPPTP